MIYMAVEVIWIFLAGRVDGNRRYSKRSSVLTDLKKRETLYKCNFWQRNSFRSQHLQRQIITVIITTIVTIMVTIIIIIALLVIFTHIPHCIDPFLKTILINCNQ